MDDVSNSLLDNLRTAVWIVYTLLGSFGLLALLIDGLADSMLFGRIRRALVSPNPPRGGLWLLVLFVTACFFEAFFAAPTTYPNSAWNLQLFALVFPQSLETAWLINIFEEVLRFGGFLLLIRFTRPAAALLIITMLFTLSHDYYVLPPHQALTVYVMAFVWGVLFLFTGLRFGLLAAYAFHLGVNTFQLGVYVAAPTGWLWINWTLALVMVVPLVYAFRRAGLWGLGRTAGRPEGEQLDREAVPIRL